jgi:CRISPR-associated endonuclease/helicase Cas3
MFFAHSIEGENTGKWQPLGAHLMEVSRLASLRAQKFGAGHLGALIGLLHDLGKYAPEFKTTLQVKARVQTTLQPALSKFRNSGSPPG